MQVNDMTNAQLDHYAAIALGWKVVTWGDKPVWVQADGEGRFRCNVADWKPTTDWAQGGLIIEREKILLEPVEIWCAHIYTGDPTSNYAISKEGNAPLIAAMRCYVASKLGEEVEES